MDILDYFRATGRSVAELARQVDINASHLQHLKSGRRYPSSDLEDRIAEATGGMVTHADWALRRMHNPRPWATESSRD